MTHSVKDLKQVVLTSGNDAWRDDAAEYLASDHWSDPGAQRALFELLTETALGASLRRTCIESLASIWSRVGVDAEMLARLKLSLSGKEAEVLRAHLGSSEGSLGKGRDSAV